MTDKSNDQTKKATAADVKAQNAHSDEVAKNAEQVSNAADTTNEMVAGDGDVSRTEHAVGQRQPDDGSYDEQREQPPLEGRDVPQRIVTVENDTPTPGENN